MDRFGEAVEDALRPHLAVGRKTTTDLLEQAVEAVVDAMRGRFIIGVRKPRPRKQTERALSLRLPVGIEISATHKGKVHTVRVIGEHQVELECEGKIERYESLKAVAVAIQGYPPSVSGWRFFFGTLSYEEVVARYGKAREE
jgi:hypothetical protein